MMGEQPLHHVVIQPHDETSAPSLQSPRKTTPKRLQGKGYSSDNSGDGPVPVTNPAVPDPREELITQIRDMIRYAQMLGDEHNLRTTITVVYRLWATALNDLALSPADLYDPNDIPDLEPPTDEDTDHSGDDYEDMPQMNPPPDSDEPCAPPEGKAPQSQ